MALQWLLSSLSSNSQSLPKSAASGLPTNSHDRSFIASRGRAILRPRLREQSAPSGKLFKGLSQVEPVDPWPFLPDSHPFLRKTVEDRRRRDFDEERTVLESGVMLQDVPVDALTKGRDFRQRTKYGRAVAIWRNE
jgi:hypothetical protein